MQEMDSTMLESTEFSTSLIDSALLDANLMDTIIVNTKPKISAPKLQHQINRTFTPSPPSIPKLNKVGILALVGVNIFSQYFCNYLLKNSSFFVES